MKKKNKVMILTVATPKKKIKGWKGDSEEAFLVIINGKIAIYPKFAYRSNESGYYVYESKAALEKDFDIKTYDDTTGDRVPIALDLIQKQ